MFQKPNILYLEINLCHLNYVKSNHLSLKYQRFTPSDCKDIEIIKFEFVAKTNSLILFYLFYVDNDNPKYKTNQKFTFLK